MCAPDRGMDPRQRLHKVDFALSWSWSPPHECINSPQLPPRDVSVHHSYPHTCSKLILRADRSLTCRRASVQVCNAAQHSVTAAGRAYWCSIRHVTPQGSHIQPQTKRAPTFANTRLQTRSCRPTPTNLKLRTHLCKHEVAVGGGQAPPNQLGLLAQLDPAGLQVGSAMNTSINT